MSFHSKAPAQRPFRKAPHTDPYVPTTTRSFPSSNSASNSHVTTDSTRQRVDSIQDSDDIELSDLHAALSTSGDYDSDDSMGSVSAAFSTRRKGFIESAKKKIGNTKSTAKDNWGILKDTFGFQTGQLCEACKKVPFHECLPRTTIEEREEDADMDQNRGALVFWKSLSKILNHRGICNLCKLLAKSIEQPEYDLLKADHIRNHLPEDPRFQNMTSFAEWIKNNSYWKREWIGGAGIWPFGYAVDRQQAASATLLEANKLFRVAEDEDVKTTSLNDVQSMYGSQDGNTTNILHATQGGLGILNSINMKNKRLEKIVSNMQVVTGQAALLHNKKRKRLPCIFMFRVYRRDEKKAGALSVRVYGHGRAPLAPLKEICHFTLRFESDGVPRSFEEQIWYGRKLEEHIDVPFFSQCIAACESMHSQKGGCSQLLCDTRSSLAFSGSATFRLIDVRRMRIMPHAFDDFTRPNKPLKYVALSYRWGTPPLRRYWIKKENPDPHASPSQRIYYEHMQTRERTWNPPGATKLTSDNEHSLFQDRSLEHHEVYIPNTIRDAIEVVSRLGLRYLWVDQLCTIQSGNDADKDANVQRMDQIYNYALFTIVAADSSHADAGLRGVSTTRNVSGQLAEDGIINHARMVLPISMEMDFEQWEERAWCFQEKLLSRRLLVFAGGFAVWYCRGGVWREDVNALDGNKADISFPWLRLMAVPRSDTTPFTHAGLKRRIIDESVRLVRLPAMHQYIEGVEDISKRYIGRSCDILNAFKGLTNIMSAKDHLDSPFRQGLPSYFLDVALLWQPKESIKRRKDELDNEGNILYHAPSSWSWAGWESARARTFSGAEGAIVRYSLPFNVEAESTAIRTGIVLQMCKNKLGEERIRPRKGTFYGLNDTRTSFQELGMFSAPKMQTMGFKDWDSWHPGIVVKPHLENLLPLLDERHLVLRTELTDIALGENCWRKTITKKFEGDEHCTISFESTDESSDGLSDTVLSDSHKTIELSHEYWIDIPGQNKEARPLFSKVGVVKLDENFFSGISVKAVILSEAQYLGNEPTPDVLGYPLYNIMLVRRLAKIGDNSFAERIGIGKIYKYAWRAAQPVQKVIILG